MSFYTLGISASTHDSSVCLLKDETILVAYSCERVSRQKHTHRIRQKDINLLAAYATVIDLVIVTNIKIPNRPENFWVASLDVDESDSDIKSMLQNAGIKVKKFIVDNSNHHLYHAAAGFYASGFDEALCLVVDGVGTRWKYKGAMLCETTTILHAQEKFTTLYKNLYYKHCDTDQKGLEDEEIDQAKSFYNYPVTISPHLDIGKMFGTVTRHIRLGSSNDAGKTMGLAAYGTPNNLPPMILQDEITSDANFFRNDGQINTFLFPILKNPNEGLRRNLAFNVQKALESIFVKRVEQALSLKNCNNIVLGGGCAMNILGNSIIKKTFPYLNVFVEPVGSDSSQSIGAALYHYKSVFPNSKFTNLNTLYLGPTYSLDHIRKKVIKYTEQ